MGDESPFTPVREDIRFAGVSDDTTPVAGGGVPMGRMPVGQPQARMTGPPGEMSGPTGEMSGPPGGLPFLHPRIKLLLDNTAPEELQETAATGHITPRMMELIMVHGYLVPSGQVPSGQPQAGMLGPPGEMLGPPGETLGPPGEMLGPPGEMLGPPGEMLGPLGEMLGPPGEMLGPPGEMLGPPGGMTGAPGEMLGPPGVMLGPLGEMLGPLGEMLGPPGELLGPPGEMLGPLGEMLGPLGEMLGLSGEMLDPPGEMLGPPDERLNFPGGMMNSPGGLPPLPLRLELMLDSITPEKLKDMAATGQITPRMIGLLTRHGYLAPGGQYQEGMTGPPGEMLGPPGEMLGPRGEMLGHPGEMLGHPGGMMDPSGGLPPLHPHLKLVLDSISPERLQEMAAAGLIPARALELLTIHGYLADDAAAAAKKKSKEEKAAAKAAEKAAKEAAKAAKLKAEAERKAKAESTAADPDDPLRDSYGDAPRVQSQAVSGKKWTKVEDIDPKLKDQKVLVRARIQTTRAKGKSAFLVLRERHATIQATLFVDEKTVSKSMINYASRIPTESIVDLEGIVVCPENPVESCSQQDVELKVTAIHAISRAALLPFQLSDASRSEAEVQAAAEKGEQLATVSRDVRLDNRFLDLRTPANQAIFRIQSQVCQLFRDVLLSEGFQEIHSPKLIAGASEGGAQVFTLDYMGQPACLAQSPQLYKQMAICADFDRVFEIGPVFRAENSYTHRHLCEFTGLDLEMAIKEHYFEVLDVIEKLFMTMFDGINTRCAKELEVIQQQYPFVPIQYKPLRLEFAEGIKMLQEAGVPDVDPLGDLNTELERTLGRLVKEKYGTDFYILHRYPMAIRPFYTMPCPDNPDYSNSYDVFIRGEEIISGAQRIHEPELLVERAKWWDIPVETIQSYVDSFKLGAPPHGGAGVGLERVVMLYADLKNVRNTSMFPRDPKRLTP